MKPKLRFKGFDGEWKMTPFIEMFDPIKNNSLSRDCLTDDGTIMNIHYGDVLIAFPEIVNVKHEKIPFIKKEFEHFNLSQSEKILSGDIIFADAAEDNTVGKCCEIISTDDRLIVSGLHTIAVRPKNKFAQSFLGYYLNSPSFHDQLIPLIQGSKISSISKKALNTTIISYPVNQIQAAIGDYFQKFDELITATEARIEELRKVKAASLQAMFPQEGETKPRLRFNGFSDDWILKKLADCLTISSLDNRDLAYSVEDVLSVSEEVGVVNQIKYLGRSYAGKSIANYRVLDTNQIVYTKSPLKAKPFGIIKVNKGNPGIVSILYAIYDAVENVYPDFVSYYFEPSYRINNYLSPLVNKGAKNTMNISDEMALEGTILIPSYEEQQKIADFFANLDRQISLEEQRLEKLRRIKAACLDNMFV